MEIVFLEQAEKDREYWKRTENKVIMNKITALLKDIAAHPYTGIGKPEPLKYELAGYWSRRINAEHRIIYSVHDNIVTVYVLSMRYHYVKCLHSYTSLQRIRETKLYYRCLNNRASLSVYHMNNGMRELTGSPLYHTVTIINNNTHSSGVSLQLTKKKRYVMFYATFFLKMRNIP